MAWPRVEDSPFAKDGWKALWWGEGSTAGRVGKPLVLNAIDRQRTEFVINPNKEFGALVEAVDE
jgi:hypothetical protein